MKQLDLNSIIEMAKLDDKEKLSLAKKLILDVLLSKGNKENIQECYNILNDIV